MKFRKKPVEIEAWTARYLLRTAQNNWAALPWPIREAYEAGDLFFAANEIQIQTLEGTMTAAADDIVIRGVKCELYPCKPDIFKATYERVDGNSHSNENAGQRVIDPTP